MSNYLFKARTNEGHVFKVLSELLQSNIKTGCFEINKQGFFFKMTDTHNRICIDIKLLNENFVSFHVNSEESIYLGFNLAHFKKMLKPVKKKDSIEFSKESLESDTLCIKIIPKEGGKVTTSFIKIQDIQNIDLELPDGYVDYLSIPASDYQKMCKDMESISQDIQIKATNSRSIQFTAEMSCVYSRSITFGEDKDINEDEATILYNQHFESEKLNNLGKISGLGASSNNHIQIYFHPELPLLFRTNVGTLGKIGIYIKSKEQCEMDASKENN
jgi:proliferating cell nuclear antigen PCNA